MANPVLAFKALGNTLLDRIQWMRQAGISFKNQRDLYEVLGYNRVLTSKQYRDRYARGGVAGRIVDALPNATWRGDMELIEDENPNTETIFEKTWNDLDTRLQIKAKLQRVDKLSRLSTYAVLLIGAPGDLSEELPRGTPDQLLYLMPFTGGGGPNSNMRHDNDIDADATIASYEIAADSPRFGLPATYQLRRTDISSPILQRPVHWSRIVHVAENVMDDEVFGQPALERVWNLLDDLDKVTGGGAEAFWLRANQGLHIDIDKDMAVADAVAEKEQLKEQAEEYKHQMTRWLRTRGVKVDTLSSDVANFLGPADAILTQIAGSCSMPKRILTGSEMGELASSQDRDNWKDQINGRQTGYAGPYIVRPLVDRLIEYGYLPKPAQYEVRWPHIQVMTEQEKAEGAKKWADINTAAGGKVFTYEEIRDKWYQMEPGKDEVTDSYKADGAVKWAEVNKTQGATVFTDDEIRKTWYGFTPLTPEQKVPITAPERVSSTAPTPPDDKVGGKGAPPAAKGAFPRAAEETEMLRVLSAAVEANNIEVIDRILGIRHAAYDESQHPRDERGQWTEGAPSMGEFDPERAYIAAYQATGGLPQARLSGKQATKVHEALSHLERMLNDPEVGLPLFSALGGLVSLQDVRDKILDLESGHAEFAGGKGAIPTGKINTMYGPAPLQMRASAVNKLHKALITIKKLLEDPDTADATLHFLKAASDAGGIDEFKTKLRTAEFDESLYPRDPDGKFGSGSTADWKAFSTVKWKQPLDPKTGRPIPIKVTDIGMAAVMVLDGKVVELPDAASAHSLIERLADMAIKSKEAGGTAVTYDLCNVSVAGSNMFCGDSVHDADHPNGWPRIEMPQLGGTPVPGSAADKLPRTPWNPNEVDGGPSFRQAMEKAGIKTDSEIIAADHLKASQRELKGETVSSLMHAEGLDLARNPIYISRDNYIIDGHHRWAAIVGRDAEDGHLGDARVHAIRVDAPISEVLHLANAWSEKFGIQQAAGVKSQSAATGLHP